MADERGLLQRLGDTVDRVIAFYEGIGEAEVLVNASWTARDVLVHIVFWHESFARNVGALARGDEPVPLKGTYARLAARALAEAAGQSVQELLERLERAQRTIEVSILDPRVVSIPYRVGSRSYAPAEHLGVVDEHVNGHLSKVRLAYAATGSPRTLTVFVSSREATCDECQEDLGRGAWITLGDGGRAFCLACADLDHLVFLAAGNAALTRRARAHSTLSAVVLRWSRARKRYERRGLLVEAEALDRAEAECLSDADARARRRERESERRAELDRDYLTRFASSVRASFPAAPPEREHEIAEHACRMYSGRVGRSAAAKALDAEAVHLAVAAHVRHRETNYDELLASGLDRREARELVAMQVRDVLRRWQPT